MAYLAPQYSANSFSKASTWGPRVIQLEVKASLTKATSLGSIDWRAYGIKDVFVIVFKNKENRIKTQDSSQ